MKFNILHFKKYKDLFNISSRIKKINSAYTLYYSTKYKMFFIVNTANNYEICLNFNNFNQNIENILKFTNTNNLSNLTRFIENENEILYKKQTENIKENTLSACSEYLNLSKKTSKISQLDINKIIGENNA